MKPIPYEQYNLLDSTKNPLGITADQNGMFQYFRRYLLQKAMSVFVWDVPANWDRDYFLRTLYTTGVVAVIKTQQFGVIPQQCSLSGFNIFYRPTYALIANPLLPGYPEQTIDVDCVVFKLANDYGSMLDMIDYYAQQFALTCSSYSCNVMTSRLAYIFGAKNDVFAKSFKQMTDQILSGKPVAVVDKQMFADDGSLLVQMFEQDVGGNFIAPELQGCIENLWNRFCTDIGLPNANRQKKEREIVDEVNANNAETMTMPDMWMDGWKESCSKCKDLFGIDISVRWRVDPKAGKDGVEDVPDPQS